MEPSPPSPAPAWHALLAPLPDDALPTRRAVAPAEVRARPEGAAIAGWEQLVVEQRAGGRMRLTLVVLDGAGQPISASDAVMHRRELGGDAGVEFTHETLGGRLEADGRFLGTRWRLVTVERPDGGEERLEATPTAPTAADEAGLRALVAELVRRAPPRA